MGYKDDFIRQMKDDGIWDSLTTDRRKMFEALDDDQARVIMAAADEMEVNERTRMSILSNPENPDFKVVAQESIQSGVRNLLEVFEGKLVESVDDEIPRLTPLGKSLQNLIRVAKDYGFNPVQVVDELRDLNASAGMILDRYPK